MKIPNLQKDLEQQALINSIYQNLASIAEPFVKNDTKEENNNKFLIKFVTFEDALKELSELKKT
jgi:hypothetical protein